MDTKEFFISTRKRLMGERSWLQLYFSCSKCKKEVEEAMKVIHESELEKRKGKTYTQRGTQPRQIHCSECKKEVELVTKKIYEGSLEELEERVKSVRDWLQIHFQCSKCRKLVEESMSRIYEGSFDEIKGRVYNERSAEIFQSDVLEFLELLN
jgi:DNA-directed RNA polymerase subunit RPC12/RpoP